MTIKAIISLGILAIVGFVTGAWLLDRAQTSQITVTVEAPTAMYASESDAVRAQLFKQPNPKTFEEISADSKLTVIEPAYGKDYWALKVETNNGKSGWVIYGQQGISITTSE